MPAAGGAAGLLHRVRGGVRYRPRDLLAEAYDAANVFLQGILEGNTDRESLLTWVNEYNGDGITKKISFDESGEVADKTVWAYKVEAGEIVADQVVEVG